AVINTLPGMGTVFARANEGMVGIAAYFFSLEIPLFSSFMTNILMFLSGNARQALSVILLILSATTTALLSYASQFTPLRAWIMYRAGADRIRSEIYLYRMMAGVYGNMVEGTRDIRNKFLERLEQINAEIVSLETAPPSLQVTSDKPQRYELSIPRRVGLALTMPLRRFRRPHRFETVKHITSSDQRASGRLPGRYYPNQDDGFNKLTVDLYLLYRVVPQRDWYVKKIYEDYERIKDWRRVLLGVGVISSVLAAIQLEPYIVITTAAVVAINTHLQLNLIGSNYGLYQVTANRLDSEIIRWENLTDAERAEPERIDEFVTSIERIFEDERSIWIQQASQAQKETEQSLVKNAGKRDGLPSLDSATTEEKARSFLAAFKDEEEDEDDEKKTEPAENDDLDLAKAGTAKPTANDTTVSATNTSATATSTPSSTQSNTAS
ncbi:MAG: SLATT domain-containing protein, partial [Chloroflexota bacterium]